MFANFRVILLLNLISLFALASPPEFEVEKKIEFLKGMTELSTEQVRVNSQLGWISSDCIYKDLAAPVAIKKWLSDEQKWIHKPITCQKILEVLWAGPIQKYYSSSRVALAISKIDRNSSNFVEYIKLLFFEGQRKDHLIYPNEIFHPAQNWLEKLGFNLAQIELTEIERNQVSEELRKFLVGSCLKFSVSEYLSLKGHLSYQLDCRNLKIMPKFEVGNDLYFRQHFYKTFLTSIRHSFDTWTTNNESKYFENIDDSPQLLFLSLQQSELLLKKLSGKISLDELISLKKGFLDYAQFSSQRAFGYSKSAKIVLSRTADEGSNSYKSNENLYEEYLDIISNELFYSRMLAALLKDENSPQAQLINDILKDLNQLKYRRELAGKIVTGGVLLSCLFPLARGLKLVRVLKNIEQVKKVALARDLICLPVTSITGGYFMLNSYNRILEQINGAVGFSSAQSPNSLGEIFKAAKELSWLSLSPI